MKKYYLKVLPSKVGRVPVSIDGFWEEKIHTRFQLLWVVVFYAEYLIAALKPNWPESPT